MQKKLYLKILIFICISSFLVISGYASSGIIPSGIFMEGVDISGLSIDEAENKVKENFKRIYFTYKNFSCSFSPEELGIHVDYIKSFERLKERTIWEKVLMNFQESHFILEKNYDQEKMEETLNAIADAMNISPKNAYFEVKDGQIITQPEKWGSKVDVDLLKSLIFDYLQKKYIVPLRSVEPKLKAGDLEKFRPNVLLAQYTTEFVYNPNRTENIKLACESLKSVLVAPGEIFSFNNTVGPREEEKGYLSAMVISGGDFVPGLGGGVCQVSSTLYNAVLLAGVEIIERHPHSLKIDYVPLGRDATVQYGLKDFKFRNNTEGYLLLDYGIEGRKLTILIYGSQKWHNTVKVKEIPHYILKTIVAPVKNVFAKDLSPGESRVKSKGRLGYIISTFRIIEINGREQKEFLFKDYYSPLPKIIEKGTIEGKSEVTG